MNKFLTTALALTTTIGLTGMAQAASMPTTFYFTATDFQSSEDGSVVPGAISGSFTLLDSIVTQVNLTIGDHTYSAEELTFKSLSDTFGAIGKGETKELTWAEDDFWIRADFGTTPTFYDFAYYVNGNPTLFHTYTGTISQVPLPSAGLLLGCGLIGLGTTARKRKVS